MNRQQSPSHFLLPRSFSNRSWIFTCVYVYLTKIIYFLSRDVIKYCLSLGRNRNSSHLKIGFKKYNWLLIGYYFEQCQAILCSVEPVVSRMNRIVDWKMFDSTGHLRVQNAEYSLPIRLRTHQKWNLFVENSMLEVRLLANERGVTESESQCHALVFLDQYQICLASASDSWKSNGFDQHKW
jgi:hypothetical protein